MVRAGGIFAVGRVAGELAPHSAQPCMGAKKKSEDASPQTLKNWVHIPSAHQLRDSDYNRGHVLRKPYKIVTRCLFTAVTISPIRL